MEGVLPSWIQAKLEAPWGAAELSDSALLSNGVLAGLANRYSSLDLQGRLSALLLPLYMPANAEGADAAFATMRYEASLESEPWARVIGAAVKGGCGEPASVDVDAVLEKAPAVGDTLEALCKSAPAATAATESTRPLEEVYLSHGLLAKLGAPSLPAVTHEHFKPRQAPAVESPSQPEQPTVPTWAVPKPTGEERPATGLLRAPARSALKPTSGFRSTPSVASRTAAPAAAGFLRRPPPSSGSLGPRKLGVGGAQRPGSVAKATKVISLASATEMQAKRDQQAAAEKERLAKEKERLAKERLEKKERERAAEKAMRDALKQKAADDKRRAREAEREAKAADREAEREQKQAERDATLAAKALTSASKKRCPPGTSFDEPPAKRHQPEAPGQNDLARQLSMALQSEMDNNEEDDVAADAANALTSIATLAAPWPQHQTVG